MAAFDAEQTPALERLSSCSLLIRSAMAAPIASTSSADEQTIRQAPSQQEENEPLLDVSVLKELARKALVDALNSVRAALGAVAGRAAGHGLTRWAAGQRCEDTGAGLLACGAARAGDGGRAAEGTHSAHTRSFAAHGTRTRQHHGVDKMFWLEPGPLTATTTNVVYLCRPRISYVKIIAGECTQRLRAAVT